MWHCFVFYSCSLEVKTYRALFITSSMFVFILTHVPTAFSFLCPCDLGAAVLVLCLAVCQYYYSSAFHGLSAYDCNLSLNDQYSRSLFCTTAFASGQAETTNSARMPRYSSYTVAILLSSAVMQSGMSVHDSIALEVKHMPCISLSLFHGCV